MQIWWVYINGILGSGDGSSKILRGTGDEKFGAKVENSSVLVYLFTAYGEICYFSLFFLFFLYFSLQFFFLLGIFFWDVPITGNFRGDTSPIPPPSSAACDTGLKEGVCVWHIADFVSRGMAWEEGWVFIVGIWQFKNGGLSTGTPCALRNHHGITCCTK